MRADAPMQAPEVHSSPPDPWALPVDDVARSLGVDPTVGLRAAEVERRAVQSGPNALEPQQPESVLSMIREAATEPFVVLLLAAGVGAVLLGEVRDGLFVLVGLIPIVGADVVTEFRGERALEALRAAAGRGGRSAAHAGWPSGAMSHPDHRPGHQASV